jgi:hypothetical protein
MLKKLFVVVVQFRYITYTSHTMTSYVITKQRSIYMDTKYNILCRQRTSEIYTIKEWYSLVFHIDFAWIVYLCVSSPMFHSTSLDLAHSWIVLVRLISIGNIHWCGISFRFYWTDCSADHNQIVLRNNYRRMW